MRAKTVHDMSLSSLSGRKAKSLDRDGSRKSTDSTPRYYANKGKTDGAAFAIPRKGNRLVLLSQEGIFQTASTITRKGNGSFEQSEPRQKNIDHSV